MDISKMSRLELVPLLVEAAIELAQKFGHEEQVPGEHGTHLMATVGDLSIIYRTPKALIFTAPSSFGIDVWEGGKCFSVIWDSRQLKDYEVVCFKKGTWINKLLTSSS